MKIAILLLAIFGFIALSQALANPNEETEKASVPENRALANDNHGQRVARSPNHHNCTANTGRQRKAKAGGKGKGKGGGGRGGARGNAGADANAGFGMNAGAGANGGPGMGGGGGGGK